MYCSDERGIAFNILSMSFKMMYTVLGSISKSLHICVFDFSCLATAFIIANLVLIVMCFLACICTEDMVALAIENKSKNEAQDLYSLSQ